MMEESHDHQYLMWMKRKQVLKSHLQAASPVFGDHHHGNYNNNNNNNNNYYYYSSWEERAFAEDAARILGTAGSTLTWPPRSYSCTFCNREFRSAQALGGHMNVHRRDRARLKQNLISPHHHNNNEALVFDHHHHHHKNDYNSLLLGENCGQQDATITPNYSSSIIWGQTKMESPNSEAGASEGLTNIAREKENIIKGLLDCDDDCSVETGLSVGLSSMFGQKSPPSTFPPSCEDDEAIISCKRLKTNTISSSLPLCGLKPCSNDRGLAFQSAEIVLGLNHPGKIEDLDLELRLGKQQKVN